MRGTLTDQQMAQRLARRNEWRKKSGLPTSSPVRILTRKLARSIARYNMVRAEATKINKKRSNGKSFFAANWREWLNRRPKYTKKKKSA